MKIFIATVCLLAVISLPAAAESPENRTEQDTLKARIYEGSVSVGVTYIINLGIRTTHGVRYLDKNLFLGGECGLGRDSWSHLLSGPDSCPDGIS